MRLSKETIEILNNFAEINPSILFKQGNSLRTVSPAKSILAQATISESFPRDAAIYDLKQFLNTVGLFQEPELDFKDENVSIGNGKASASYFYANPETITAPPSKEIKLSSEDISFKLEKTAFTAAIKAAAVLGLPEIVLVGREGTAYLTAQDSKNKSSHRFEYPVGTADAEYKMIFKVDNMKQLPRDYQVCVSAKGIALFEASDVRYWVATETGSSFNKA